jgi:hypothetical protein
LGSAACSGDGGAPRTVGGRLLAGEGRPVMSGRAGGGGGSWRWRQRVGWLSVVRVKVGVGPDTGSIWLTYDGRIWLTYDGPDPAVVSYFLRRFQPSPHRLYNL